MPFDLVGYSEAAPGTGTPAIAAGGNDQIYRSVGDDIFVKERAPYLALLAYFAETTPGYAELRQPSLKVPYNFLKSADLNDAYPTGAVTDLFGRPLPLFKREKLNALSNNATDEDTIIGLILSDGRISQAMKDAVSPTHILRGSADQTLTANSWTKVTMTWVNDLPAGRYSIVGMTYGAYISSGFMAGLARLILNESIWRPGVPIAQLAGDKLTLDHAAQAPWENWPRMKDIELEHDSMPDFEVLSPAALTDHAVVLQLEQIA